MKASDPGQTIAALVTILIGILVLIVAFEAYHDARRCLPSSPIGACAIRSVEP